MIFAKAGTGGIKCTLRGIIDTEAEDFDLTVPTQVIRDHTVGHLK